MVKGKTKYKYRSRPKKRYRRGKQKIPLGPVLGLVGTVLSARHPWASEGDTVVSKLIKGNFEGALNDLPAAFLGVTPKGIDWATITRTWAPTAVGIGIHLSVGRFANKYLRKVPYVNI